MEKENRQLRTRELNGTSCGGPRSICGRYQLVSSRFQFVEDHRGAFDVKRLCRMLQVSRSGFYRWLAAADTRAAQARADTELAVRIAQIHQRARPGRLRCGTAMPQLR
jgi:hypothetical protein